MEKEIYQFTSVKDWEYEAMTIVNVRKHSSVLSVGMRLMQTSTPQST
jgi:hypothetical protein